MPSVKNVCYITNDINFSRVGDMMGITVREVLNSEFFKDYKVLAGHGGLDNQVQGLTLMDAPDGYKWVRGREFVLSTGYMFNEDPVSLKEYLDSKEFKCQAALGIKIDRFLKKIPQCILYACDENNLPLIYIPLKDAWMDIFNAVNVLVMNKNIRQFNIGKIKPMNFPDITYQSRKVNIILNALEYKMNFPSMLYDLANEKAYYSSAKFREIFSDFKVEDFWNPSFNYSKEILCDNLKMARYRFFDGRHGKERSWITVPISVADKTRAYFILSETSESIDYFDQFAIRIGFVQLQSMYEQILVMQSLGEKGFESFINKIISDELKNRDDIIKKATELNFDTGNKYYMFVMEQANRDVSLLGHNDILTSNLRRTFGYNECHIAFIDDNRCLFLYKSDENLIKDKEISLILSKVSNYSKRVELDLEKSKLIFGFSDSIGHIYDVKRNYLRCLKTIEIGPHLYPDDNLWTYSRLGVFAWIDIKDDEIDMMMREIKNLYESDENKKLVETLKVYIECKMNFSAAAEKLFLHINTVRSRIDKITDLIDVDLDDPISRLKIELLLRLI